MSGESVKVAVRVRPFNQREKDRQAKCVIKMEGQMTLIHNPETPNEEPKKFSFDHSYWSHDGFKTVNDGVLEALPGSQYASQRLVFEDLGQGVLNNAFEGYNCSLFAYGQTGSGKSYSMVGYGSNRGIVPITCDELFKTMSSNADSNRRYEVLFSMLEIYNEQVRDLLSKDNPKGGLQVRQNPKLGMFYVEGLKKVPVGSYAEIEKRMEQGTQSRTVASTQMNATSSRAHTVVTIIFDQIIRNESGETKKSSTMNLVDLAGSERADSTGATGDRLKEGANINKSLSALGNVISALADLSMGKKKVMVPYRDSILTKLLQNALGGNSKTIMIAALSPADINYDETLGTLRYADRAKKIQNKAVINENPIDKLIRELKAENEKLKKAMESGGLGLSQDPGMTQEDIEKMRKQMEEEIRAQLLANQELLKDSEESMNWDQKLAAAQRETEELDEGHKSDSKKRHKEIHLVNLNEDPMLSGVILHFIKDGETTIGRKDAEEAPNICLSGLSIQKQHAILRCKKGVVEIDPLSGSGSKTKVNGVPLTGKKKLTHKDRLLFGSNHLYVFMHPKNKEGSEDLPPEITWEFAQKEIAQVKGFATSTGAGLSKDQQIAQEQVLEILPLVSEVNAVSEELNKQKSFEVVLVSAAAQESAFGTHNSTKVMVKMKNLLNGNTWLWERGKFMNRRYLIQDMYQRFQDGDDISKIPKESDPFWEPTEDVLIGSANVFLQSLSYALDFDDKITITDYKGQEEGFLKVHVAPVKKDGKPIEEDSFVDDPQELLDKPYHFKVTVEEGEIIKPRFSKGVQVKYRVYMDKNLTETPLIRKTLKPHFKHSKVFSFDRIMKEHLEFFESGCITFLVYGIQEDTVPDPKLLKYTTRELRQMEQGEAPSSVGMARRNTHFALETASDQSHLKTEILLLQRKYERLAAKERRMQDICKEWDTKPEAEKQFDPFYRSVSAVAFSTGSRLKTRVQLLNQIIKAEKFLQDRKELRENGVLSNARLFLENIIKYGILIEPLVWIRIFLNQPHSLAVLSLVVGANVFILAMFYTEKALSKSLLSEKVAFFLQSVILILLLVIPAGVVLFYHPNPLISTSVLGMYTVAFLKLVSYASVNQWCRQAHSPRTRMKRSKSVCVTDGSMEDEEIVSYPSNLTIKDLYYFMVAPTLCYEMNFPRTLRIRKRFLLKRLLEMLFVIQLILGCIQQWILPLVHNSLKPLADMDAMRSMERLLKLAVPNHFIWLMFFYWFFHSTLNVIAELLKFGDREFYRDWWNSDTVNDFWKNWNIPVHRWATRHLYKPLLKRGYSKMFGSVMVFFVSAFFHEYLLSVPLRMFRLWAFMGMLGQVPLALLQVKYLHGKLGNFVVWLSLILGQPIAILAYFHDYYVMQIAPQPATPQ